MFQKNLTIALAMLASAGFAETAVIEDFQNTSDPANWQATPPAAQGQPRHGQTQNATVTGDVPVFSSQPPPVDNLSGQFTATWSTASPAPALGNIYNSTDGNTYWAVHYNINAPSSLPNNSIPTATGLLEADVRNDSGYPIQVALVVDSTASSQLERGPLVTVAANSATTYTWNFATTPPIGFVSGDGAFSGVAQRVKSLLVYTPVAPTTPELSLLVDNIRQVTTTDMSAPTSPRALSLTQGATAGSALLQWDSSPDADVAFYRIYIANDSNFGSPITNRLAFPALPAATVASAQNAFSLEGLTSGQNTYVAISAIDSADPPNESPLSQAMAINLESDGTAPTDRLVLDNDAFSPGQPDFIAKGYFHAAVYSAQAFQALGRTFDTVTDEALAANLVELTPDPAGVVVWSNLQDGETPGMSISGAGQTEISNFINNGGNLIVSGSAVAQDIGATPAALEALLKTQLQSGNIGVANVDPSGPVLAVNPFSTNLNPTTNAVAYATSSNDGLLPANGSVQVALYTGIAPSSAVAGIAFEGSLVFLGFAFETAGNAAGPASSALVRQNLMGAMVDYLLSESAATDWQLFD